MKKSAQVIGCMAFAWVLMDSLVTYFIKMPDGSLPPVNAVLPFILLIALFQSGWRAILPPPYVTVALMLSAIGFLAGLILIPEAPPYRAVEMIGAFCAFGIGYFSLRWSRDERLFVRAFLFVSGVYAIICILALLEVYPKLFPVFKTPWAYHGTVVMRPDITTNANFEVFHLFPAVLALSLPYRFMRFWIALAVTAASFYILMKLQTRSGVLVLVGTLLLCMMAPMWSRTRASSRLILFPLGIIILLVLGYGWIQHEGALLIARFGDVGAKTSEDRLASLLYLFEHVYNPLWWLPRGNGEFIKLYGTIPHSNITAMFVEGGILGLYMWITVFLLPLVILARMFFRKQLDPLATMILLGGTTMMIVQLSLNLPFFKQPWLWAGAIVGVLYRARERLAEAKRSGTAEKKGMPASLTGRVSLNRHRKVAAS